MKKNAKRVSPIRFNLYLRPEEYNDLERLRKLTGKISLADTVRSALKLYRVVYPAVLEGADLLLHDRQRNHTKKLLLV